MRIWIFISGLKGLTNLGLLDGVWNSLAFCLHASFLSAGLFLCTAVLHSLDIHNCSSGGLASGV